MGMNRRTNLRWLTRTPGVRCCVRATRFAAKPRAGMMREDGATLVEMAFASVMILSVFFGIMEVSYALYSLNYVSNAAREATRYASIRGANSCGDANVTPYPNCGLSPTQFTSTSDPTKNPLLAHIEAIGYPGLNANNTSLQVNFLVATKASDGTTTWASDASCSTADLDSHGNACNNLGNMINVQVTYQFPLNIPFWKNVTVPVSSKSQLMISE